MLQFYWLVGFLFDNILNASVCTIVVVYELIILHFTLNKLAIGT